MALRAKLASADCAPQVKYRPGGEADRAGALGRPCGRLKRHGRVVAGEGSDVGVAVARVEFPDDEYVRILHGLENPSYGRCSQTEWWK